MKIVAIIFAFMLCAAGAFTGLLVTHKIPSAKIAKASPAAAKLLTRLGLLHPDKRSAPTPAPTQPSRSVASVTTGPKISQADADEKQSLDAERQQIAAEQAKLDQSKAASANSASLPRSQALAPKLADIYDTMSADDLARIFAKQPDSQVAAALTAMDEKKAGKVMAALPPDRSAKLAALLDLQAQPQQSAAAA